MAARGGGDGEVQQFCAGGVGGEVGDEKLFAVDSVVEWETGEFNVAAEENPAVGG
ncbi:hypothetical protein HanRHA438_Chr03g0098561 [Helianthus annuus]|nr:hypothetical protein HanIR_Chr12g0611621 [Helianthus annuus]KAJ0933648.1 hypothetical protein HanRHA438_Chr03g0098561 [Helianthus annuus]